MEKIEIAKILEWHNSGTLKTDEAIEKIFSLFSVGCSFSVDQMHQAYIDGYNEGFPEPCFDINNYR